jgi:hypothetical protein
MNIRGAVGDSTRTAKTTRILVAFQPSIGGCHDFRKNAPVKSDSLALLSQFVRHRAGGKRGSPSLRPSFWSFWYLEQYRKHE